MLRKSIFWLHLGVASATGLVVLVMSATGVLLTYQKQMTTWADLRTAQVSEPATGALPLTTGAILKKVGTADALRTPTSITWRSRENAPVEIVFGREGRVFVDPWTGAILSAGSPRMRAFFQRVMEWHRWLAMSGDGRERGGMITGAANLGFLFLVVSGLYLWWPRNWSRRAIRNVMMFRRGLSPKARDFNWHNVIGFWSLVPLFVIVLSGAVISYEWAGNLVYRVVGESPPVRGRAPSVQRTSTARDERGPSAEGQSLTALQVNTANPDALLVQARQRMHDWRTITMQIPDADAEVVTFSIDRGMGGEPHKRAQLKFDRVTGDVADWAPFSASTPGRKARSVLRFAHTGEIGGPIGQTIAGLASLGAVFLVVTGFSLAIRRAFAWGRRRFSRRPVAAEATIVALPPAPRAWRGARERRRRRKQPWIESA